MTAENDDSIEAAETDYLFTAPSQLPDAGDGLFTAIDIHKDEVIARFHGERLTANEAKSRADQGLDQYFMNLPDGRILDAMRVPGFAKFANDAKGLSTTMLRNNSRIGLDEDSKVCLTATRKIKAGEEVFCSYGKRYWMKHG